MNVDADGGYVMPMTLWLMFAVLSLMAFLFEGGQLLNQTRHAALVADTAARQVTQLVDVEDLRADDDPALLEDAVIAATESYLAGLGYAAQVTVDPQSRVVLIRASRQWDPGALRAIGFSPREIVGTSTGMSLLGIDGG